MSQPPMEEYKLMVEKTIKQIIVSKKGKKYKFIFLMFLDEEKESNDEKEFYLPQLNDNRYFNSLQSEQRQKRNKSVSQRNQNLLIDQTENLFVKKTLFDEQVSQYIPHRNLQKSFDNYQYFKEHYNDEEPQPINTKKPKTRQVSFYDNQSTPQMNLKAMNPIKSKSQLASPFLKYQNQAYLIQQEQYRNSIESLQQLKVNQLKQRQMERTSQNIEELEQKAIQDDNDDDNYMNIDQQQYGESSESIDNKQFEDLKQARNQKFINEFSEIEFKQNQNQPLVNLLQKNSNLNKLDKSPKQYLRKQRHIVQSPIIEIQATDSLKGILSSQDEKNNFQNFSKRQSIHHNLQENLLKPSFQQNHDKLKQIKQQQSSIIYTPQKNQQEIFNSNKSSLMPISKQKLKIILKQNQFINKIISLQSRKEQSPRQQQYQQQENNIQRSITPIKKIYKNSYQSPVSHLPISDYSLIKKLEQNSPILKQLRALDKQFEQEQKENKEMLTKMNKQLLQEQVELEQVCKTPKTTKTPNKSQIQTIHKQQRSYHIANFSNVNKQKRKSSKDALQLDIPKKECKKIHEIIQSYFQIIKKEKELESILKQLKSFSKIVKIQKQHQKNQKENLE